MEVKEKRERTTGVLLYLEERYETVDEKITNFDPFPEEIQVVLDKYIDVFDTCWIPAGARLQGVDQHGRPGSIIPDKGLLGGSPQDNHHATFRKIFLPENSNG